jgi:hypothetical protein
LVLLQRGFDSDTLVLLSSNAQPRYADDIVRVLALPAGSQIQFRYGARLVQRQVSQRIANEQLAGQRALICYLTSGSDSAPREMVPVRIASVIRAERVGSSCLFTLAVGEYLHGLQDNDIRHGVSDETQRMLPQHTSTETEGEAHYAFLSNVPSSNWTKNVGRPFEGTVQALSQHAPFNADDFTFYAVHRIAKLPTHSWFGTWPKPLQASRGIFTLRSGERYEIQTYTYSVNNAADGLFLSAKPDDGFVQLVSRGVVPVDSRYDIKSFVFATEADTHRRFGGITLGLAAGNPVQEQLRYDVNLRFVFKPAWVRGIFQGLAAALGTTGPALLVAERARVLHTEVAIAIVVMGIAAALGTVFLSRSKS